MTSPWRSSQSAISSSSLVLPHLVHFLHEAVGELLHVVVRAALVVFGDELFLQHFLDLLQGIAAYIADGDLGVFTFGRHVLGKFPATLLGETVAC